MALITSGVITAGAAGAKAIGVDLKDIAKGVGSVVKGIGSLFGGGSSKKMSCGQRENQLRSTIEQYLTPEDVRNLLTGRYFPWRDRRPDISRPEITPGALAYYTVGGSNCKAERSDEQRFVKEVKRVLEMRIQESKQSIGTAPAAADTSRAGQSTSGAVASIPGWVWGVGAALVGGIIILFTQGRP